MAKIDRNSIKDAQRIFEKLIPESSSRLKVVEFLSNAINYADILNSQKWNLNLDINGQFIRFNVGHEYCIEIKKNEILIICDRTTLKPIMRDLKIPLIFRGHIKKQKIHSKNIDEVPDCLAKTKNSIGCLLPTKGIEKYIDYFITSNKDFIKEAINTCQLPQMREAHSKGVIEYLTKNYSGEVSSPIYELTNLPTIDEFIEDEKLKIKRARKLSKSKRLEKLKKSITKPKRKIVSQFVFQRNPYVVAEVLERANGICEKCGKRAPFLKDIDGSPFLEVHHIIPLAEGGNDTIENAIALCPNCHRHAHYGKKTY
ncbi:HNH endonuclease [Candidatus Sulfidibacterium hydrothermale]|uniref:HNH endonuclease n=1 Tax=Candidatus Sulfidibacterium hydrothermale TaxID=2875962 RepID=UPI001F0AAEF9|nr:HNH endonuclease signature motif containing protein [Candidatus Sulfidibacterium hydrothermale]UBM61354.1 HNH endonuclease [Candidatus Sulfidibacterium hydrothermale]